MRSRGAIVVAFVAVLAGVGFAAFRQLNGGDDQAETQSELVVMLGNSITEQGDWDEMFPDRTIFNAGFAGYTTEQLVPIAREVAKSKPRAIFVLAGINDIFQGRTPGWTAARLDELVAGVELMAPETQVVVQTVMPSVEAPWEVMATNTAIRSAATERGLDVLDLYPEFDDGTGALRPEETYDGIHLTAAGYERWRGLLRPRFDRFDAEHRLDEAAAEA